MTRAFAVSSRLLLENRAVSFLIPDFCRSETMTEETGEWLECVIDNDYDIWSEYPYPLRRKGSVRVVTESISPAGYVRCTIKGKQYMKHRVIAQQFIENDDPAHKIQVDHINHNRADNRVVNLRWTTPSENNKNRGGYKQPFTFIDELPETAEPLDAYNGHEIDGLFIDQSARKLYLFNGVKYRELTPLVNHGIIYYTLYSIEGKKVCLSHKVLFG